MKLCTKCKIIKDYIFFCTDKKSKDGYQSWCKNCKSKQIILAGYNRRGDKPYRTRTKEQARKRYHKNKLTFNVSRQIRRSLKSLKNNRHWEEIVGFSLGQLRDHLENKFVEGMSWDNYGRWHIDHIRPVSSFNFNTCEDYAFKQCWDLSNLQPLWAIDNIIKGKKYNIYE